MNKPPHNDDDIDAWLGRGEPLFRRSHADDDLEPPNEIDNVVLANARAALRASSRDAERRSPAPAFFTLDQWALPLGLAATLILAVAVVMRVNPDEAAIAEKIQDIDAPASPRDMDEPAVAAEAVASTAAEAAPTPPLSAPPPEVARPQAATGLARQRSNRAEKLETDATGEATINDVSAGAAVDAAAAPQEQAVGAFASAPALSPPPSPPPPASSQAAGNQVAVPKSALQERRVLTAPAGARAAESAAESEQDPRSDPNVWYRRIVELRTSGNTVTADKEWRDLKARYPSFIPPDTEPAVPR